MNVTPIVSSHKKSLKSSGIPIGQLLKVFIEESLKVPLNRFKETIRFEEVSQLGLESISSDEVAFISVLAQCKSINGYSLEKSIKVKLITKKRINDIK